MWGILIIKQVCLGIPRSRRFAASYGCFDGVLWWFLCCGSGLCVLSQGIEDGMGTVVRSLYKKMRNSLMGNGVSLCSFCGCHLFSIDLISV